MSEEGETLIWTMQNPDFYTKGNFQLFHMAILGRWDLLMDGKLIGSETGTSKNEAQDWADAFIRCIPMASERVIILDKPIRGGSKIEIRK